MIGFTKPKREVTKVFIHCTASDDLNLWGNKLLLTVDAWHRSRKFAGVGYHYLIDKRGAVLAGRPLETIPAAQRKHNTGSIAICVHGLEVFTSASLISLKRLCNEINTAYGGSVEFWGHCDVEPLKTCPVFNYRELLGIDESHKMKRKGSHLG